MFCILPSWNDFPRSEPLEDEIALVIIHREQPTNSTIQGIFPNCFQCSHEPLIQELFQNLQICFIVTLDGERLTQQIVGFLNDHLFILIVNNSVVWKILDHFQFTIFSNDCPFPGQDVMTSIKVFFTIKHFFSSLRLLEFLYFLHNELFICQLGCCIDIDQSFKFCFEGFSKIEHHSSPPFFIIVHPPLQMLLPILGTGMQSSPLFLHLFPNYQHQDLIQTEKHEPVHV